MAKLATLIDDYQDNLINPSLWVADPGVAETGGRIRITPSSSYPVIRSASLAWDLTSSQITAHIPVITADGFSGTLDSGMVVGPNNPNTVAIRKVGAQLVCSKSVGGVQTQLAFTPYSAVNHLYWRIRQASGKVHRVGAGNIVRQHGKPKCRTFAMDTFR